MLFTKCWRFILLSSNVFLSINTVTTHTPFNVKVYCCRSINFHKYRSIHTGRVPYWQNCWDYIAHHFTLEVAVLFKKNFSKLCTLPSCFLQVTEWYQQILCFLGTSMANFSQFHWNYVAFTHSAAMQQSLALFKTVNTSCNLQNDGGSFNYLAMFS